MADVTILLKRYRDGDKAALDALAPVVYSELRKLAVSFMRRERAGSTLQPTALIHEAYLALVDQQLPDFESRSHFFGVAASIMRQVLIGHARKRNAKKRGGGGIHEELDENLSLPAPQAAEILALDQALERLASQDERKAKVIELKYFGGLGREEIATAMGITLATVKRDLTLGEAWLRRELAT